MTPAPVELVAVGAGLRGGRSYGPVALAHPDELRFVAVVEPNPVRRAVFARAHDVPATGQFASVEEWLDGPVLAQGAVVATPDRSHTAPALAALAAGYDVLLEKPLAPSAAECLALVAAARAHGRRLHVCHVLRHTAFFETLHELVTGGVLGQVTAIEHRENVAGWHMAHSYVRGAYADTGAATPFLLAKSCHDLDLLVWNHPVPWRRVSSTGALLHFRPERAPEGAPARCTDGCPAEADCPFSATHVYLGDPTGEGWRPVTPFSWMPLTDHGEWDPARGGLTETAEERLAALRTGPYGRCVYRCANDALDTQTVWVEFEDGVPATLVVHGHAHDDQRTLRYDGSRATLRGRFGDFSGQELTVHHHRSGRVEEIPLPRPSGLHGGGDVSLVRHFAATLAGREVPSTEAAGAIEAHLLGFAAEEARTGHAVVDRAGFLARQEAGVP